MCQSANEGFLEGGSTALLELQREHAADVYHPEQDEPYVDVRSLCQNPCDYSGGE